MFGNVVRKVDNVKATVNDPSSENLSTQFEYNLLGKLTKSIPPNGNWYATTYSYNTLGQLLSKTSPDAGTVSYLYDKNGNIRLIKDQNHSGALNSVDESGNASMAGLLSGFTLTLPGRVRMTIVITGGSGDFKPKLNIKANGVVIASATPGVGGYTTLTTMLPNGHYSYDLEYLSGTGQVSYSVRTEGSSEFVYNKYDAMNRVIETGEYLVGSSGGAFTKENAENTSFPSTTTNIIKEKEFYYDIPSDDPVAAGQRNLNGKLSYTISYRLGIVGETTVYSYDEMGRVEWIIQKSSSNSNKKIYYTYDLQGNLVNKSVINPSSSYTNYYTFNEYDKAGRLNKVYTGTDPNGSDKVIEAEYSYLAGGQVKRLKLGNHAQGVDYIYNERDWLTQINHQNLGGMNNGVPQDPGSDGSSTGCATDRFGMVIGYNLVQDIGAAQGVQEQYNGNISWVMYSMKDVNFTGSAGTASVVGWTYSYDGNNRLKGANFGYYVNGWQGANTYDENNYNYDKNGNILSFQRYGSLGTMMDNLSYNYITHSNRLEYIVDVVAPSAYSADIDEQNPSNYIYDGNGNITKDAGNGVAFIVYDINNLPVTVYKTDGSVIQYWYNAAGSRIRKTITTSTSLENELYIQGAEGQTEAVCSLDGKPKFYNMIAGGQIIGRYNPPLLADLHLTDGLLSGKYEATNSITAETNVSVLGTAILKAGNEITLLPGFRAVEGCSLKVIIGSVSGMEQRYYYLKDHLGSIRVTVDVQGSVVSYNDYSPFGMQLDGRNGNLGVDNEKYKFTGKERDIETNYDYFGARYYDCRIGRWLNIDPLVDKFPGWSSYNYCFNNSIRMNDPNGEFGVDQIYGRVYLTSMNNLTWFYYGKLVAGLPSFIKQYINYNDDLVKGSVDFNDVLGDISSAIGSSALEVATAAYSFCDIEVNYDKFSMYREAEQNVFQSEEVKNAKLGNQYVFVNNNLVKEGLKNQHGINPSLTGKYQLFINPDLFKNKTEDQTKKIMAQITYFITSLRNDEYKKILNQRIVAFQKLQNLNSEQYQYEDNPYEKPSYYANEYYYHQ